MSLCIQGQEEVGEKILVYGVREQESAARASTGAVEKHTPESFSPEKSIDYSKTQVGKGLGKFLFRSGTQIRVSYDSD